MRASDRELIKLSNETEKFMNRFNELFNPDVSVTYDGIPYSHITSKNGGTWQISNSLIKDIVDHIDEKKNEKVVNSLTDNY